MGVALRGDAGVFQSFCREDRRSCRSNTLPGWNRLRGQVARRRAIASLINPDLVSLDLVNPGLAWSVRGCIPRNNWIAWMA